MTYVFIADIADCRGRLTKDDIADMLADYITTQVYAAAPRPLPERWVLVGHDDYWLFMVASHSELLDTMNVAYSLQGDGSRPVDPHNRYGADLPGHYMLGPSLPGVMALLDAMQEAEQCE